MQKFIETSLKFILIYFILVLFLCCIFYDIEKSVSILTNIIQATAIIIGGFWAYYKFGWEKKCENIITLRSYLMEYQNRHNWAANDYREDNNIAKYKLSLMNDYNQLSKKIHLSYYVPKELRNKVFETIWLTIGNDTGKNFEKINENWIKFEKQLKEIYEEFDNIIS